MKRNKKSQNDCLFIFELKICFQIQYLVINFNNFLRIWVYSKYELAFWKIGLLNIHNFSQIDDYRLRAISKTLHMVRTKTDWGCAYARDDRKRHFFGTSLDPSMVVRHRLWNPRLTLKFKSIVGKIKVGNGQLMTT